jgi:hypothetical protein
MYGKITVARCDFDKPTVIPTMHADIRVMQDVTVEDYVDFLS